jgi:hypothetical protein
MSDREEKEPGAGPSKPPESPDVWLPPRLRERLEAAANEKPESSSPIGAIVMVAVLVLAIGGVWFLVHSNQVKAKAAAAKVEADRVAFTADSLAQIARADSIRAKASADSLAAFLALPKSEQRKILAAQKKAEADKQAAAKVAADQRAKAAAGGATATAARPAGAAPASPSTPAASEPAAEAAPVEAGPFVIDTGTFLVEEPANAAAEALKGKTPLPISVASVGTGDDATFHVFVGKFTSRSAADKAAAGLLAKGLVTQAQVMAAPK